MPIITLQRRLRQAGRIRIGAKVPTKNGGSRPSKLDTFRFTSPDQSAIEAVAEIYGGECQKWEGSTVGDQWEVFTKTTDFDILVPPTDIAFSQFFELWSGGGCQRRCDGITNLMTDAPCLCDPSNPECRPTTRLNVILTAIEGIGVWRIESHGFNSAAELSGSIEVLKSIQQRNGAMVLGRLMLEQRQSKSIDVKTGKPETFNFAVPVLDFKVNVAALTSGDRMAAVTPIQSNQVELPSVAEQLGATTEPAPKRRANAAAPLPSTGLKPRGMSTTLPVSDDLPGEQTAPKQETKPKKVNLAGLFAIKDRSGNSVVPTEDDDRHKWASAILKRDVESFTTLTQIEVDILKGEARSQAIGSTATQVEGAGYGESQEPF